MVMAMVIVCTAEGGCPSEWMVASDGDGDGDWLHGRGRLPLRMDGGVADGGDGDDDGNGDYFFLWIGSAWVPT